MEDVDDDGMIVLKRIFKECDGQVMDCVCQAQDRDTWRALVDMVMNIASP